MQIAFWSEDKDIRYETEGMQGYEIEDWDQLKKEMISKWRKVEPERRNRKDSLTRLFNETQQEGGVKKIGSSVTKEMIKERTMVQARDGGYILSEMDILRNYIEAELEVAVVIKGKSQFSKSDQIKSKKKTRFEDESWEEVIKQMKDIVNKIENPPAQEAHFNKAPKEVNPLKDVLDQLK
ncbi:hypothetical protein O181_111047 [Austropuccinia psidii MF-1]|uniref:Uncharacterized protein n=1 Tax=Austropuccinia psidii MF-1 TaxID=1389203 RepID=A0A9Q3JZ77_9BASI|nr:hypothetical protein [Austropuccinia psidii MF-1]